MAREHIRMEDLPELAGWITLPEAASMLGLTRQRMYQMVQEGLITSCMKLGHRPVYIVREAEIEPLVTQKAAETRALLDKLESRQRPDEPADADPEGQPADRTLEAAVG